MCEREGFSMETTGVVRRIDDLGRVVIPKEIRRTLGIKDGTSLEIFVENDMVALKKYSSMNNLMHLSEVYCDAIYNSLKKNVVIVDRDNVVACSGKIKKDYLSKQISTYLEDCINKRLNIIQKDIKEINIVDNSLAKCSFVINTIICNGDSIGAIIIFDNEGNIGDIEVKMAEIAAQFLGKHIEE